MHCKECGGKGRYTGIVRKVRDAVLGFHECCGGHGWWRFSKFVED